MLPFPSPRSLGFVHEWRGCVAPTTQERRGFFFLNECPFMKPSSPNRPCLPTPFRPLTFFLSPASHRSAAAPRRTVLPVTTSALRKLVESLAVLENTYPTDLPRDLFLRIVLFIQPLTVPSLGRRSYAQDVQTILGIALTAITE